jgi:RNAse (barnase) inhibitor barstar
MTAFSNIPAQAVLPLDAYRLDHLEREARRADQRWLYADCGGAQDKAAVLAAIGRGFGLPPHYGANLDALYDCLTDLEPAPDAAHTGLVAVLAHLPAGQQFSAQQRDALLDVFREAADYFYDRDTAFRVFYSVRRPDARTN